jgi:peptidoglycan glycosyltransferase
VLPAPTILEGLTDLLTPERTRSVLLTLRGIYFAVFAWTLLHILLTRVEGARRSGRGVRLALFLIVVAFVAVFAYQATWQLAGFGRKQFVAFMERYDPRPSTAVRKITRGRIFDSQGRVLAVSDPSAAGARRYPFGAALAHVVGYRHPLYGITGVENAADALISGYMIDSREDLERVGRNAMREQRDVGTNLVLTLDAELQQFAYSLMTNRPGAIVALDPHDGSIRLLVTSPSFDPNEFQSDLNRATGLPLLNRALHGRYPPGSTFKLATAALAIEKRVRPELFCGADGYLAPGARRPIRDHEYYEYEKKGLTWSGFGTIDLSTAFAKSSNSYFSQAGVLAGVDAFNTFTERLWINARVPIYEGPSGAVVSQRGNIPVLGRGERRELAQLSIGQGRLLVTPLHLAMLTAAVAEDGQLWRPRLLETEAPFRLPAPMRPETARRVRAIMRDAVRTGTGRGADIPGLEVCGKTGTAQNPGGDDHAWFACLAPASNPQLALVVLVENAGYGSRSALPIAAAILREAQIRGHITVEAHP